MAVRQNPGTPFDHHNLESYAKFVLPDAEALSNAYKAEAKQLPEETKVAWLKKAISLLDLTTLSGDDTTQRVRDLCDKAVQPLGDNLLKKLNIPDYYCAAVCVYPARVCDVVQRLSELGKSPVKVASVAGGFPSGQYKLESRLLEIKLAVADGANEIDTVINRCAALEGHWQVVYDELHQMRQLCKDKAHLKTILATGELKDPATIYVASQVAMMAGSDFIKTSTGKETINATLPVSLVMCRAIKEYCNRTGYKVGFKPAGGIRTADEALEYMCLIRGELGEEWLCPELFRIGASSLLDSIAQKLDAYKKDH